MLTVRALDGDAVDPFQLGVDLVQRGLGVVEQRRAALVRLADRDRGLVEGAAELQQRDGQQQHQDDERSRGDQRSDLTSRHMASSSPERRKSDRRTGYSPRRAGRCGWLAAYPARRRPARRPLVVRVRPTTPRSRLSARCWVTRTAPGSTDRRRGLLGAQPHRDPQHQHLALAGGEVVQQARRAAAASSPASGRLLRAVVRDRARRAARPSARCGCGRWPGRRR